MADPNSRLVYSTDGGRVKPARETSAPAPKRPQANPRPDDGVVRVHRAKSPKGGKTMSAISGMPGSEADLDALLKRLKAALGTGGNRDGRTLLLQGEHRERIVAELAAMGTKAKLAGG
jgi:translation initiation factor 1